MWIDYCNSDVEEKKKNYWLSRNIYFHLQEVAHVYIAGVLHAELRWVIPPIPKRCGVTHTNLSPPLYHVLLLLTNHAWCIYVCVDVYTCLD